MNIDEVKKIAVIGAGNMGHQISLLCAIHGYTTTCTDIKEDIRLPSGEAGPNRRSSRLLFTSVNR